VNFFSFDPHYFEQPGYSFPTTPRTLRSASKNLDQTGMAAIGRMTMSDKERVVLIHYYRGAIVATALRYPDEMERFIPLFQSLENFLSLMKRVWLWWRDRNKQTVDLDLSFFHDHSPGEDRNLFSVPSWRRGGAGERKTPKEQLRRAWWKR